MREILLRRALDPTDRVERLVQRNPSLAMATLHAGVARGQLVSLQRWQGSQAALALLSKEHVAGAARGVESTSSVTRSRDALVIHVVERPGARPSPPFTADAHLGPEAVARLAMDKTGHSWRILAPREALIPGFLRALREAEDAFENAEGAAIPRYAAFPSSSLEAAPAQLLSPKEKSVLAQAHRDGYFAKRRTAGIAEVGRALKMPASTALYHLRAAQRKLVEDHLRR